METNEKNNEKLRYSDDELEEFKELILSKLEKEKENLEHLKQTMAGNDREANDTAPTFKALEEGNNVLVKETSAQMAARSIKFIKDLEAALVRIKNKTYGVCRITGKLIPKERLRIVPHATTTVEGKMMEKKNLKRL